MTLQYERLTARNHRELDTVIEAWLADHGDVEIEAVSMAYTGERGDPECRLFYREAGR